MLAAYFCHTFLLVEYKCSLIKVDWLDACIALRVAGAVLIVYPPALDGKQGPIPEEIYQTLLTNRKQENLV
jgi:hypothetical protein